MIYNKLKAATLTIGQYLLRTMDVPCTDPKDAYNCGRKYIDMYRIPGDEVYREMKHIMFEGSVNHNFRVLDFVLKTPTSSPVKTPPITFIKDGAKCSVRLFKGVKSEGCVGELFLVEDFSYYFDTFMLIDNVQSTSPNAGKALMKEILEHFNDIAILVQAGFLYYGDYEMSYENFDEFLDKVVKFYEELGFVNVNAKIGAYEESVAMLRCDFVDDILNRK